MKEDYISFEKVLKELQIEEDELKKLVSAGEIKAFRDAEKMKFKKEEIERLKDNKASDPDVIELLDAEEDLEIESEPTLDEAGPAITEELSFDDDDDLGEDLGMATAQISDDDLLDGDMDLGSDDADEEVELGSLDLEEEGEFGNDAVVASSSATDRARIKKTKIAGLADGPEEEVEPQWALALMIASVVVLIFGVLLMMDIATSAPSPLVDWLVGMFQ